MRPCPQCGGEAQQYRTLADFAETWEACGRCGWDSRTNVLVGPDEAAALLLEATEALLGVVHASTDQPGPAFENMSSPAQRLREDADRIERRDSRIHAARRAAAIARHLRALNGRA